MPVPAQFEEKEYEIPLYLELYNHAPLWSPGQVLEAQLGVDAVLRTESRALWQRLGFSQPLRGFALNRLRRMTRRRRALPRFAANLFLQVKRPTELFRRPKGITATDLPGTRPFWRFELRERQHDVLSQVAVRVRNRALVAYASPAFADLDTLYDCIDTRRLIENTTFIEVSRLQNHRRWVYNEAGSSGVRCSSPERIVDAPFFVQLEELRASAGRSEDVSPLNNLAGSIERVIAGELRYEDPRTRAVRRRFAEIDDITDGSATVSDEGPPARASAVLNPFAKVHVFSQIFGLEWFVVEPK